LLRLFPLHSLVANAAPATRLPAQAAHRHPACRAAARQSRPVLPAHRALPVRQEHLARPARNKPRRSKVIDPANFSARSISLSGSAANSNPGITRKSSVHAVDGFSLMPGFLLGAMMPLLELRVEPFRSPPLRIRLYRKDCRRLRNGRGYAFITCYCRGALKAATRLNLPAGTGSA
jgi:hypothetical protein